MKSTIAALLVTTLTLQIPDIAATIESNRLFPTIANATEDVLNDLSTLAGVFEENQDIKLKDIGLINHTKLIQELREGFDNVIKQNQINLQLFAMELYRNLASCNCNNAQSRSPQNHMVDFKAELKAVNKELDLLKNYTKNIENQIKTDINDYEDQLQADWNEYASAELSHVRANCNNSSVIATAERLINSFINRYGNYIDSCASEFELYAKIYQQKLSSSIAANEETANDLLKLIDACDKLLKHSQSTITCEQNIKNEFTKLKNMPTEVRSSIEKGNELLKNGFGKRGCVVNTIADFEKEKRAIRLQIDEIL